MTPVEQHYEALLAAHYTWMSGGLAARVADNRAYFEGLGVHGGHALDLGCGSGFQTLALRALGVRVTGVDLSAALLDELHVSAGPDPQLTLLRGDICDAACYAAHAPFDLAVCMGDTLSHLSDEAAVAHMLAGAAVALRAGGRLVLRYRNLSAPLHGLDRIIPVRHDETRIFTCFLEYTPTRVMVHDVLHLREGDTWVMRKSAYPKLRIAPERVNALATAAGLHIDQHDEARGLVTTVATRA
jgi:SAM-dependent methyltransferase